MSEQHLRLNMQLPYLISRSSHMKLIMKGSQKSTVPLLGVNKNKRIKKSKMSLHDIHRKSEIYRKRSQVIYIECPLHSSMKCTNFFFLKTKN